MSERRERVCQWLLVLATSVYLFTLFLSWWVIDYHPEGPGSTTIGASANLDGLWGKLGELCAVIAVAILVVSHLARIARDRWLALARRQLAIALVIFTSLAVADVWRSFHRSSISSPPYVDSSHFGYGAYAAPLAALAVLLLALGLDAGGARELARSAKGVFGRGSKSMNA